MNKRKRDILKGLAVGSAWTAPVIGSTLLPVHAETTLVALEQFDETQSYVYNDNPQFTEGISQIDCVEGSEFFPDGPTFTFDVTGLIPAGDGTLTVNVVGDVESVIEFYTVFVDGSEFVQTIGGSGSQCTAPGVTETLTVSMMDLQTAAQDGSIIVIAQPDGDVDCWCGPPGNNGPDLSSVTVTLEFPYTT